jgi:hypothetical protein
MFSRWNTDLRYCRRRSNVEPLRDALTHGLCSFKLKHRKVGDFFPSTLCTIL